MADIYDKCLKSAIPIQKKMEENMTSIRGLDSQSQLKQKEVKQKISQMISGWKRMSKEEKRRNYELVEQILEKARELSDEKIRLAEETYEMVDNFIQKLDNDTDKFNTHMQRKMLGGEIQTTTDDVGLPQRRRGTGQSSANMNYVGRKKGRDYGKSSSIIVEDKHAEQKDSTQSSLIVSRGDMPVDPNEPRYCICNQVSFGHMVGCDNKDCPLEWFHFSCVGLTASPKGKWFCPRCRDEKEGLKRHSKNWPKTPKNANGKDAPANMNE